METVLIFVGGLLARLLVFVLLLALFATPILAVIYFTQGAIALRRRVAGTVDAGGARFKPGLAYTTAHTWVKRRWGRNVRVGLDDVARRILSGVSSVTLPPPTGTSFTIPSLSETAYRVHRSQLGRSPSVPAPFASRAPSRRRRP